MAASRAVMEGKTAYHAKRCYKIIRNDFGRGDFYVTVPQNVVPFLLQGIVDELNEGIPMPKLIYPL